MIRNYCILLFFICFSLLTTNNLRNLEDVIEAKFAEANNLRLDSNVLKFEVVLAEVPANIQESKTYYLTIIYRAVKRVADCLYTSSTITLSCSYNANEPYYGPIILAKDSNANAQTTIKLGLSNEVTIQQNAGELKFIKAYDLSYLSPNSTFLIEIEGNLPDNSFVQVDVKKGQSESVADCTLSGKVLTCKKNWDLTDSVIKLCQEKKYGSISWSNTIDENIPLKLPENSYTNGYGFDAEFKSNRWNFFYHQPSIFAIGYFYRIITVLIKPDETLVKTFSFCNINKNDPHECYIEAETQTQNDLFYLCDDDDCTKRKNISRLVSLTYKKAYELKYINYKWNFKIEIEEECDRNEMNVTIGVENKINSKADTASCICTNKILECKHDHSNQQDELHYLFFDKKYGSVTWTDSNHEKIKIPLEISLQYISSYELVYRNSWSFKLEAKLGDKIPADSLILVDILGESGDLATCEGNKETVKGVNAVFSCTSNLAQSTTITINKNKVSGSVTWSSGITGNSASIDRIIELDFVKAYDMTFDNNKKNWKFLIECQDTSILSTSDIYKLQLSYKSNPASTASAVNCNADCTFISGTKTLSCSITSDFDSRNSQKYLLLMKSQNSLNDKKAIIWKNPITETAITLKTDLTFVNGTLSHPNNWILNLNVKDPSYDALPINSKVIINIKNGGNNLDVTCNAESNELLKCDTKLSDASTLPNLTLEKEKRPLTSITWKNTESNEDFYYFYLTTNLNFVSVDQLQFLNNKWQFKLKTSSYPEKYKIIVDILYDGQSSTATCVKDPSNSELKLCTVDNENQSKSSLVQLSNIKSAKSTITWNSLGSNKDIIIYDALNVNSVKGRAYENTKWSFKMILQSCDLPLKSNVKIDLNYISASSGQTSSTTATCILYAEKMFTCIPDIDSQSNEDTFTIAFTKNLGSVTYTNSESNLEILSTKELTLGKAYDLLLKDSIKWEFKLLLTSSNLQSSDNEISVDIELNGSQKKAACTRNNNLLICSINKASNSDRIKLINNLENTEFIWLNINEPIELYIEYNIKYINCYGGFHENKWKFIMKYLKNYNDNTVNDNVIGNYALLDIFVGSKSSTALCKITEKFLECESQHLDQTENDVIKIKSTKTDEGTITISNSNVPNTPIESIKLSLTFSQITNFKYDNGKIGFQLIGNLKDNSEKEIGEKTITKMNLVIKKKNNDIVNLKKVVCETNAINDSNGPVILTCGVKAEMNKEEDDVEIDILEGKSEDLTFNSVTENIKVFDHSIKPKNNEENKGNNDLMIKISYLFSILLLFLF